MHIELELVEYTTDHIVYKREVMPDSICLKTYGMTPDEVYEHVLANENKFYDNDVESIQFYKYDKHYVEIEDPAKKLYILVACEESQAICKEFRKLGCEAYSCDLQECTGNHKEWHIHQDVLPLLHGGNYMFTTQDGVVHHVPRWDLIVAHPVCTYLTVSGNRWFDVSVYGQKAIDRYKHRDDAIKFFMEFVNAESEHIAIENPIGCMSSVYRKPDQIIQPWQYGDNDVKTTCLWLKNLPLLVPEVTIKPEIEYVEWIDQKTGRHKRQSRNSYEGLTKTKSADDRQRLRSKTYPGIARAIAKQYYEFLTTDQPQAEPLF